MKECPKCHAMVRDVAKFCPKCRFDIKKYEEEAENRDLFCYECGAQLEPGDDFCVECGAELKSTSTTANTTDPFNDNWLGDIESSVDSAVDKKRETDVEFQTQKMLSVFEYESNLDGTYTITGLKVATAMRYVVPDVVVSIGEAAFEGCEAIHITLPDTLLSIGNYAFRYCRNLSSINLPESIMIIGDEAFADCELLDIEIPASARRVGENVIKNTVQDKKRQEAARRRAETLATWGAGNVKTFGAYYKNANGSKSPMEWIVLERDDSRVLLLSKYGIDSRRYHIDDDTTWAESDLRKWLNDAFFSQAFSADEQRKIQTTAITTEGSVDTNDKIFALSVDEFEQYVHNTEYTKCTPTACAKSNGAWTNTDGFSFWWLRSPGKVVYISITGSTLADSHCVVRPAMWIDLYVE